MKYIHISYLKTKIGEFILGSYDGKLCIADFRYRKSRERLNTKIQNLLDSEFLEKEDEITLKAKKQLGEYIEGKRKDFDLPLLLVGTAFQKQVWNGLLTLGYGEKVSYLDLAKKINQVEAVRAVANANGANSLALIVPCHRIIASDGSLGGYGGGVSAKKKLLQLEANHI